MGGDLHNERMRRFAEAGLYLVTSQKLSAGRTTPEIVRAALAGGVRLIQLREKDMALRNFLALAEQVRNLTAQAGALLIINDRVDVALEVGADGVHLGQDDLPIPAARRLGPDLIVGASTHSVEEALRAQAEGASYINIGPIYPTGTKRWEGEFLGVEGLKRIAAVARIPFTVMGGIKREHIPELVRAGARIIALVTAVTAAPDPRRATEDLLAALPRRGTGVPPVA
jgi:thiamine-phosphate pyrophosphorylase